MLASPRLDKWSLAPEFALPTPTHLAAALDYPRINQFPEWFTVEAKGNYRVSGLGAQSLHNTGAHLTRGVDLDTHSTAPAWITVVRQQ